MRGDSLNKYQILCKSMREPNILVTQYKLNENERFIDCPPEDVERFMAVASAHASDLFRPYTKNKLLRNPNFFKDVVEVIPNVISPANEEFYFHFFPDEAHYLSPSTKLLRVVNYLGFSLDSFKDRFLHPFFGAGKDLNIYLPKVGLGQDLSRKRMSLYLASDPLLNSLHFGRFLEESGNSLEAHKEILTPIFDEDNFIKNLNNKATYYSTYFSENKNSNRVNYFFRYVDLTESEKKRIAELVGYDIEKKKLEFGITRPTSFVYFGFESDSLVDKGFYFNY